jgi:hypothetical protein
MASAKIGHFFRRLRGLLVDETNRDSRADGKNRATKTTPFLLIITTIQRVILLLKNEASGIAEAEESPCQFLMIDCYRKRLKTVPKKGHIRS